MQRHFNIELHDNDILHYIQLYLYNLIFVVEQYIIRNSRLNSNFLRQLMEILHNYNLFINIYKTTAKRIQSFITNTKKEVCIILNS